MFLYSKKCCADTYRRSPTLWADVFVGTALFTTLKHVGPRGPARSYEVKKPVPSKNRRYEPWGPTIFGRSSWAQPYSSPLTIYFLLS